MFEVFFSAFLYQKGNLTRIRTGLDAYPTRIQTHTPLSRYPPYDYSKKCICHIKSALDGTSDDESLRFACFPQCERGI